MAAMETHDLLNLVTDVRFRLFGDRINLSDVEIQTVLVEAKRLYKESR